MLTALIVQWIRTSNREAARIDRELDRLEAAEAAEAARSAEAETPNREQPVGAANAVRSEA